MPGLASQDPETYWISSRFLGSKDWKPQIFTGWICQLGPQLELGFPPLQSWGPRHTVPGSRVFLRNFKPVFGEPKVGCGVDAMMAMAQNLPGNKIYVGMPEIDVSNHIGLAWRERPESLWSVSILVRTWKICLRKEFVPRKSICKSQNMKRLLIIVMPPFPMLLMVESTCRLLHTCYQDSIHEDGSHHPRLELFAQLWW